MDETTKVIIATISGFIIAFFAEPVKNYFENRNRVHNLRIALYKELYSNYSTLDTHPIRDDLDVFILEYITKHELRMECYRNTLQNDISLFYQLREASAMNALYSLLSQINTLTDDLKHISSSKRKRDRSIIAVHQNLTSNFLKVFTVAFHFPVFSAKLLKKLITLDEYNGIMEKGKELLQGTGE